MFQTLSALPGGRIRGELRVPGDKSISHRSIMLGALAEGETRISGFLEGADALATMNVFRMLGVAIDGPQRGAVTVRGAGLRGLRPPAGPLDCGNSGTSMRLLCGLLAGQSFESRLLGDASLSRRPMRRVIEPLALMGAKIDSVDGHPPLLVHPVGRLRPAEIRMGVASAQVKSALILAGLYADGTTRVTEPAPTRDHTERMLAAFGVEVGREGSTVSIVGGQPLSGSRIDIPADISSAAFFLVAASIGARAELTLRHVGINPTRTGVLHILRAMGADITEINPRTIGGEPVADLRVRAARLKGLEIPPEWVPLAIDEFPVLFVAAACAEGDTVLRGAQELRVKESDRIAVMAEGLAGIGMPAQVKPDGMRIVGRGAEANPFAGGTVESHGDHRIAMAFAVAALRSSGPITILDTGNVTTSFPGFADMAASVGMRVRASIESGPGR
ncbi:MAG: 3-phosphoshikimate 1-carboxyvinyltransferase [Lautropia sp.]|nr:3-phosphoshikimate 1-carboxyvinyltransferase [Lautropia sp.]